MWPFIKFMNGVGVCTSVELPKQTSFRALEPMMFICLDQEKSDEIVMPRYLTLSTISSLDPFSLDCCGKTTDTAEMLRKQCG